MKRTYLRTHDVLPRASLDRSAFVIAFALGVGGGIFFKFSEYSPFISAGFAAFVLIAYAAATAMSGQLKLDPEEIGDNCYYLGFLFTLTSLAVTLYQVASPVAGTNQISILPSVISGFGVALSSTIVGVFLRVFFMQMRPDFVASEKEAMRDLAKANREFKGQLSIATRDLKSFAVESLQHASEREERIRIMTEKMIEETYVQLADSQKALIMGVEKLTTEVVQNISKDISRSFDETVRLMGGSIKTMDDSLLSLSRSVNSMDGAVGDSANFIANYNTDIERTHSESLRFLESISQSTATQLATGQREVMAGVQKVTTEAIRNISKDVSRSFDESTKSMGGSIKIMDDSVTDLQETISTLKTAAGDSVNQISKVSAEIKMSQTETTRNLALLETQTIESDEAIREFSANLARAATQIESRMIPSLEALEERLAKLPEDPPASTSVEPPVSTTVEPSTRAARLPWWPRRINKDQTSSASSQGDRRQDVSDFEVGITEKSGNK